MFHSHYANTNLWNWKKRRRRKLICLSMTIEHDWKKTVRKDDLIICLLWQIVTRLKSFTVLHLLLQCSDLIIFLLMLWDYDLAICLQFHWIESKWFFYSTIWCNGLMFSHSAVEILYYTNNHNIACNFISLTICITAYCCKWPNVVILTKQRIHHVEGAKAKDISLKTNLLIDSRYTKLNLFESLQQKMIHLETNIYCCAKCVAEQFRFN